MCIGLVKLSLCSGQAKLLLAGFVLEKNPSEVSQALKAATLPSLIHLLKYHPCWHSAVASLRQQQTYGGPHTRQRPQQQQAFGARVGLADHAESIFCQHRRLRHLNRHVEDFLAAASQVCLHQIRAFDTVHHMCALRAVCATTAVPKGLLCLPAMQL